MDRVFLGANVLFSMAYGGALMPRILAVGASGGDALLTSAYALEEARRNLAGSELRAELDAASQAVTIVAEAPVGLPCPLRLPDKDSPVLLAALQARATHFLTGDRRHFGPYFGTLVGEMLICLPSDYLSTRAVT
jgi:hypothetical protein